jgi:hypothetical protein
MNELPYRMPTAVGERRGSAWAGLFAFAAVMLTSLAASEVVAWMTHGFRRPMFFPLAKRHCSSWRTCRTEDAKEACFVYFCEAPHHQTIRRVCGTSTNGERNAIGHIKTSLERQRGFELDDHTIGFYGRCARCRRRRSYRDTRRYASVTAPWLSQWSPC